MRNVHEKHVTRQGRIGWPRCAIFRDTFALETTAGQSTQTVYFGIHRISYLPEGSHHLTGGLPDQHRKKMFGDKFLLLIQILYQSRGINYEVKD